MKPIITKSSIDEVLIIRPQVIRDHRGYFTEVYRRDEFQRHDLPFDFVQLNQSGSVKGVIRGLHFQWDPPMAKLMRVTKGRAFLVAVDIRKESPTIGKWVGISTDDVEKTQLWAPAGFARGFCVLSDYAEIQYLCTGTYNHSCESGIRWNDPDIGIEWPIEAPLLSDKDKQAMSLAQWLESDESDHFIYSTGKTE